MQVHLSRPDITDKEIQIINEVIRSPILALGPKMIEFEKAIADYIGVKHAISVNSGTSGLHLLIRAYGISDGDEVITTPFSLSLQATVYCTNGQSRYLSILNRVLQISILI